MKVRFWIVADESDIYEYKTNLTEDELEQEARDKATVEKVEVSD